MVAWLRVTAIGDTVISALTIVGALYLMWSLAKKGTGKLRVRLLVGMVMSDFFLGVTIFVANTVYLSGTPFVTGTAGCNALAFLVTSALFTQNLWTILIAVATTLLLKYPLSRATMMFEKYSWLSWPFVYTVSFVHAGGWWATYGWASQGNLCYYASHRYVGTQLDAKDLVQFLPRASVFVIVVILYSTLFSFLRRPDTIHLSSHFRTGQASNPILEQVEEQAPVAPPQKRPSKILAALGSRKASTAGSTVNPDAPWEQLEFVTVGKGNTRLLASTTVSPEQPHMSSFRRGSDLSPTAELPGFPGLDSALVYTPPRGASISTAATLPHRTSKESDALIMPPDLSYNRPGEGLAEPQIRVIPPSIKEQNSPMPVENQRLRSDLDLEIDEEDELESKDGPLVADDIDDHEGPAGQTLAEFFQEYNQEAFDGKEAEKGVAWVNGQPQMSASAYFNRQASLLMLYFPLAYMIVFSVSLIRLIYGMVSKKTSPLLSLLSAWMVVSVGLIDAAVYVRLCSPRLFHTSLINRVSPSSWCGSGYAGRWAIEYDPSSRFLGDHHNL